tara:strand:+ start:233 stop:472 length:240 start_codon:yes stop_codon:yes gene_type:complete
MVRLRLRARATAGARARGTRARARARARVRVRVRPCAPVAAEGGGRDHPATERGPRHTPPESPARVQLEQLASWGSGEG